MARTLVTFSRHLPDLLDSLRSAIEFIGCFPKKEQCGGCEGRIGVDDRMQNKEPFHHEAMKKAVYTKIKIVLPTVALNYAGRKRSSHLP
jgi:hypothetical protein